MTKKLWKVKFVFSKAMKMVVTLNHKFAISVAFFEEKKLKLSLALQTLSEIFLFAVRTYIKLPARTDMELPETTVSYRHRTTSSYMQQLKLRPTSKLPFCLAQFDFISSTATEHEN